MVSEQTAVISLHTLTQILLVTDMECLLRGTKQSLGIIQKFLVPIWLEN
jgi:hypothetical protein